MIAKRRLIPALVVVAGLACSATAIAQPNGRANGYWKNRGGSSQVAYDNGYRDGSSGASLSCRPGADCVYARYLAVDGGPERLAGAGITDVASFSSFYWTQQLTTAGTLLVVTAAGALGGAILFGLARPRRIQTARQDNAPESQPEIGGRPA